MPIEKVQGLRGLKGLSSLSPEERDAFMQANSTVLNKYKNLRNRDKVANILYMNQRYINTFGKDAFNLNNNGSEEAFNMRNLQLRTKGVTDAFKQQHGNDGNFNQLASYLDLDGMEDLLNSDYLGDKQIQKRLADNVKAYNINKRKYDTSLSASYGQGAMGIGLMKMSEAMSPYEQEKKDRKNDKEILDRLFSESQKRREADIKEDSDMMYFRMLDADTRGVKSLASDYKDFDKLATKVSGHYAQFKDSRWLRDYSPEAKLKDYAKYQALKQKYGDGVATQYLANSIQNRVAEAQDGSFTGNTLKGVLTTVWSDLGSNVALFANMKSWGNIDRMAILNQGKDPDKPIYDKKGNIVDYEANDSIWTNPAYWNNVYKYNTFSPTEIKLIEERGGVSKDINVREYGYTPDFFSWDTMQEGFKQSGHVIAGIVETGLTGSAGKAIGWGTKAALKGVGLSAKAMQTASKVGAITNNIFVGATTGLEGAQLEAMGTFEEQLQSNREKIQAQVNKELRDYQLSIDYNSKAVKAGIDTIYQQLKAQDKRRVAAKTREGVTNLPMSDETLRAQAKQLYTNQLLGAKEKELQELHRKDDMQAARDAAKAYGVNFIMDYIKNIPMTTAIQKYKIAKGSMRSTFDNMVNKNVIADAESLGVSRLKDKAGNIKRLYSAKKLGKELGKQLVGGFMDEYLDGVNASFAGGVGNNEFDNYIKRNYDPKAYNSTMDSMLGSMLSGLSEGIDGLTDRQNLYEGFIGMVSPIATATVNANVLYRPKDTWKAVVSGTDAQGNKLNKVERLSNILMNPLLNAYAEAKGNDRALDRSVEAINKVVAAHKDKIGDAAKMISVLNNYDGPVETNHASVLDYKDKKLYNAFSLINAMSDLESMDGGTSSQLYQDTMHTLEGLANDRLTKEELDNEIDKALGDKDNTSVIDGNNPRGEMAKRLKTNAQYFMKMKDRMGEIQNLFSKSPNMAKISPAVQQVLIYNLVASDDYKNRYEQLQKDLGLNGINTDTSFTPSYAMRYTTVKAKNNAINARDREIKKIDKQQKELTTANDFLEKKIKVLEKQIKDASGDEASELKEKLMQQRNLLESRKFQLNNLSKSKDMLTREKEEISKLEMKDSNSTASFNEEDILNADVRDIAFILDPNNASNFSKGRQEIIEKTKRTLQQRDPEALTKIRDAALLANRVEDMRDVYGKILDNAELAASYLDAVEYTRERDAFAESLQDEIKQHYGRIESAYITKDFNPTELREEALNASSTLLDAYMEDHPDQAEVIKPYYDIVKFDEDAATVIKARNYQDLEAMSIMDTILNMQDQSNSKEELQTKLEGIVDSPDIAIDTREKFETLLKDMETLGYQRDSTILEDRKQRKEREAKQKEKEEAEKKRVEEASKAAAEKQKKEAEEKQQQQGEEDNFIPTAFVDENDTEEVDFGGNNTGKEPKVEAGKEDNTEGKEGSSEAESSEKHYSVNHTTKGGSTATGEYVAKTDADGFTHITYSGQGVAKHKVKAGDFGLSSEQLVGKKEDYVTEEAYNEVVKDSQDKGFTIDKVTVRPEGEVSIETPDGITIEGEAAKTIYDNLFGEKKGNTQVDNTNDSLEGLEKQSNITVEGDIIKVRSENIDEQMKEDIPEGKEVTASDVTSENDIEEESKMQEKNSNAKDNVLSGNAMFPYEQKPLEDDGILKMKVGAEPHDVRNTYTAWMKAAGVNLQNIIDHELASILQQNPHAKVKFMAVAPKVNATNDYHMKTHLMLVLDYDDSINKGITSTHDDANGGVFESHGKKYLVVGTVGYGNRNANKFALYQTLWNYDSSKPTGIVRQGMIPYFKENPTERFYVNDNIATEVVPYSLIQGYRVKQLTTDESPFEGSISKLLADKERNPYGYTMDTMAWGIQEASQFMIVGVSLDEVRIPRNKWANLGRAFALVHASNGKMFPVYLKPLFYQEMKDGALKEGINALLQDVTHVEADKQKGAEVRTKAINRLCSIFFFSPEGDAIYTGKSRDVIYMYHDGKQIAEFNLDSSFDRNKFLSKLWDMNPRINITGSVLADTKTLAKYDEAGALDTDVAMLGTAGSYFDIYPVDGEGKMIVQEKFQNPAASSASDSDYRNTKRSQVPYRNQFYTVTDTGEYYLYGKPITDEKIIRQLDYNKQIVDRGLVPAKSEGVWKYYIMSEGEHPEVVKLNENNKEVRDVPEEQAKKIIEEYRKQREAKAKEKAVEDALKEAEKQGKLEAEVPVEMDDSGITIDPNTGEAIQEETKEAAPKEEDSRPEEGSVDQEVKQADVKHIDINVTEHKATQRFSDLIKNPKYSFRILKIARDKWKDAPKDFSQLGTFLKGKGVNVDNIGTTEKDIESWMKTLEDCK